MDHKITRRSLVRIVSYAVALCLVLGMAALSGYTLAGKYRADLEYTYLRALNDLSDYMENLELALQKGIYANTSTQQYGLISKVQREAEAAKSALGQLPLNSAALDDLNQYIAQVGDYSLFLSGKLSSGEGLSEEEMSNLETLGEYAASLSLDLQEMTVRYASEGALPIGESEKSFENLEKETEDEPVFSDGFRKMSEGLVDYPALLYDGPFSDHIAGRKSKFLEGKEEVSEEAAGRTAADFLNVPQQKLTFTGSSAGNLPTYSFSCEGVDITVTKAGGYVDFLLNSREIGQATLTPEQALEKADSFLLGHGMENLKKSYYAAAGGVCMVNYAFEQGEVTCYSDLVKVSVALDTGEIVAYDAAGYLMNHTERSFEEPLLSPEQASARLSPRLSPEKEGLACVPTRGLNEVLCYEFECTGHNGDRVLVYLNAETGLEENIFILLMSDNGTLVM